MAMALGLGVAPSFGSGSASNGAVSTLPQDSLVWPIDIEEANVWIDLISAYTPTEQGDSVSVGPGGNHKVSCRDALTGGADGVADAARQRKLWWDKRLQEYDRRGETESQLYLSINPDHGEHTSDWEFARTFAHEGIHWEWPYSEGDVDKIIKGCFLSENNEDDELACDGCGGGTTTTTCVETQVYVRSTYWHYVTDVTGEWYCEDDQAAGSENNRLDCYYIVVYGGYWEEVERGEWVTQTVCTTTE